MLLRKLFRTAWRYKAQFISMVLMVAIGMGVFLGFNIEWKSIEEDTGAFFEKTKYADFRLYSETGFSEADIEAVKGIDGVDNATRFLSVNAEVKGTKNKLALMTSEDYTVSIMQLMEGEAFSASSDGIWLSDRYAEENDIKVGDTLTLTYQSIEISGEVAGLCKSGEMMICTSGDTQLMPDYTSFGFAYISAEKKKEVMGEPFYPQINILSDMKKEELENAVKDALGQTLMVTPKEDHTAYAGALSEAEEGKTMGSLLPPLFLVIGMLTMVTTMHRIAVNEKTQIGTLKALGFRNKRILTHYTAYGFVTGLAGTGLGIPVGYGIASVIISQNGMMSTYFDLPDWSLHMPVFCVPVLIGAVLLLTLISFLSVKQMLKGTAAEALRPYVPKRMKRLAVERLKVWEKLSFGNKWNLRDILRHKSRSAMTLLGVLGCMVLSVGGLGMRDSMLSFMTLLDKVSPYATKITLSESATNEEAKALAEDFEADWVSSSGISYDGQTVTLEIYNTTRDEIRLINEENEVVNLSDDGAYLCLRLQDTAAIGDEITFSPYGSEEAYTVRVAGYLRSVMTESIFMSSDYADEVGINYHIGTLYTDEAADNVSTSSLIAEKQAQSAIMETYNSFLDIMNIMIMILAAGAVLLGLVVLYNLGVMSYIERSRELATLKVLGFRDKRLGRLLISQNVWLTALGVLLGIPAGVGVLKLILYMLASEYELSLELGPVTYLVSVLTTFGVSLLVGFMVSHKNKKIDMVEALKSAE